MKFTLSILASVIFLTCYIFAQPSTFYGVQVHFGQFSSRPDVDSLHVEMMLDSIKNAGIKIIRDECYWSEVEKKKGIYTFPKYVDDYVSSAVRRGINILMILDYNNPLYANHSGAAVVTDSNRNAYAEYCKQVVARYSPMGVRYFEIWNEPNNPQFWDPTPNASDYTKLLKTAYTAIKQVDSTVTVIGCATSPAEGNPSPYISWLDYIRQVVSYGGLNFMDGVSFHLYRVEKSPESYLLNDIANLQAIVGNNKALWLSEIGYHTSRKWPNLSQVNQALYVSKLYLLGRTAAQLKQISYYDLKNDGTADTLYEHNFGLMNYDLTPKPAYTAYKTLLRETGNKSLIDQSIQGSWYKLTFGNTAAAMTYAFWFSGGQASRLETFNKSTLRVTTYLGEDSYIFDKDKTVNIAFSNEPKFITEIDSLPSVDYLEFINPVDTLVAGQSIGFNIIGYTRKLEKILIDNNGVKWSFPKSLGSIDSSGRLTAVYPGKGVLTAFFGGKVVTRLVEILPSYKYRILEPFNSMSSLSASYSGMLPATTVASIDTNIAVSRALLVDYAFQYQAKTKHKIVFNCDYQMPGEPDSILIDVYNNGNGHVINLEVSDKDEKVYNISSASDSLLNVKGWKSLKLPLNNFGSQYNYPARLKKVTLYTLQTGAVLDSIYTGKILLDNLRIHSNLSTGIKNSDSFSLGDYKLFQNYPNPFNPETTIAFQLIERGWVKLKIYNLLGQEIATLFNNEAEPGTYKAVWNASGYSSGIYIYTLSTKSYSESRKMQLLK